MNLLVICVQLLTCPRTLNPQSMQSTFRVKSMCPIVSNGHKMNVLCSIFCIDCDGRKMSDSVTVLFIGCEYIGSQISQILAIKLMK